MVLGVYFQVSMGGTPDKSNVERESEREMMLECLTPAM